MPVPSTLATAPNSWSFNLGRSDRIPVGKGLQFQVGETAIAVFRSRDGSVFATQATCPHKGGSLADGILGSKTLVCPLHSLGFDLRSGEPAGHDCGSLRTYPARINAKGEIIVIVTD
jgi:nitrite reductase (NADH) small subunit